MADGVAALLDRAELVTALDRSADPPIARTVLTRMVEAHPAIADELLARALVRDGIVALACASRSLSSAMVADESLLEPLRDAEGFAHERSVDDLRASWAATEPHDAARLRWWKRRELLRVAVRDLLGVAELPVVGRELAAVADVCLAAAIAIAGDGPGFAVVGMGKLGGRELNYASDVDVLFVHEGDGSRAERLARAVLTTMREPSADGIVFRTDANLRPEGRSGPLTRTLDSYASYYEEWAQTWEFQALLKARFVAGDASLGAQFTALTRPLVWPDVLRPDAVREIRAMKERSEEVTNRKGLGDRELKRGRGGIRDIEFAVQLLQLVHGRHDDAVRSATTLDALRALAAGGYVEADDAARLDDAYRFLRTVEHRLQLYDEQQTHTLPADVRSRTRLARVLGYRDHGDRDALDVFEADHRAHQAAVRSIHERLFFAPILDALAGVGPLPPDAVAERLAAFGFTDIARTRAAVRELAYGLTRRSKLMQQLLPVILEWLSSTPDPDLGLLQLRRLAEGPARSASLATTFRDAPVAAERVCILLGSSRVVGEALRRQPEFVDVLAVDDAMREEKPRAELVGDALDTLEWRGSVDQRREGLRRFKRRELLRIASRDLLGFAPLEATERELTALAEAALEAALAELDPQVPMAVIGMGRLGGAELSYASDIDVLFVYEGDRASDFDTAERTAEQLVTEIGATTSEGQTFRIDARLRPEGNQGPLARSLVGYATYYERWGLTWERQALSKARFVAGDAEVGTRFCALVDEVVYGRPFSEEDAREIRRTKARIERERIPPGEDPQFHLKLGRGSLSDVEFLVQLLQLQHGRVRPELRVPGTIDALGRLRHAALLTDEDADALEAAYRFCERARNARYLQTARPSDALPTDRAEIEKLAVLLGYVHQPATSLRDDYRRLTRRARRVVEREFYGSA
ncbi:MAG TPA: bifunctional [glutamine synthetase] adenylyltransferase/[glutamine synthetase]-adenylyl-L-tyrosine phosphorylase [Acidimicrobiia bacterium]|nr:bifunctional [glutamine synthetase] adenylyltransferase/[glutamine synthetase]-adenylyl-L-tyrosine phosphorylase [Acidimicrobiia bacterium]